MNPWTSVLQGSRTVVQAGRISPEGQVLERLHIWMFALPYPYEHQQHVFIPSTILPRPAKLFDAIQLPQRLETPRSHVELSALTLSTMPCAAQALTTAGQPDWRKPLVISKV